MNKLPKGKLIQLIHIAKNQLGLDDDVYRDVLSVATGKVSADGTLVQEGKRSCSKMNIAELRKVYQAMQDKGFKAKSKHKAAKPKVAANKEALISKIEALLADDGKPWEYATGMAKKMFGKEDLRFCDKDELWRITAAMQKQQNRKNKDTVAVTGRRNGKTTTHKLSTEETNT